MQQRHGVLVSPGEWYAGVRANPDNWTTGELKRDLESPSPSTDAVRVAIARGVLGDLVAALPPEIRRGAGTTP